MNTLERTILTALIRNLGQHGYKVASVWDDGAYILGKADGTIESLEDAGDSPIVRPLTVDEALDAVDSVDVSTIHFTYHNALDWGCRGIMVVLGNGEDCISDYHSPRDPEPFCQVIEEIYDKLNRGDTL